MTGLLLTVLIAGCSGGGSAGDATDGTAGGAATGDATADAAGSGPLDPGSPAGPTTERPADDGATADASAPGAGPGAGTDGPDAAIDPSPSTSADADGATGAAASTSPPMPDGPPPEDPGPAPQPGVLTAGDHDDQLNPERYRDYASRYLQSANAAAPAVDLARRVTIAVTDADGAPFAGARVRATSGQVALAELVTPADGLARLYPDVDALPDEFDVTVGDRFGDVIETVTVRPDELDGARRVEVRLPATSVPAAAIDLALVIDTTGSMGDELAYLQAELSSIVGRVADAYPGTDVRVGFVAYRDDGDEYVVRSTDLTDDVDGTRTSLATERADGGGDYPEAMDRAMVAALALGWRDEAVKVALLVADAPPHADRARRTFDAALEARSRMIHVVPVAASGVAADAQYLMRAMAAVTQARYLFLTDDSGVGLPHEAPDITCYLVTRLDGLIVRTVRSLVEGVRVEPSEDEILRRVGDYDEGRCLEGGQ